MKVVKGLAVLFLVLVVLVVGAAVVIPMVVDPNDYKPQIVRQVQDATGRELTIEGDLKLSVFPWLGLDIGPTRLSNAPEFGKEPFASVKAVSVRVKLLPLLQRRVEADTVLLEGLRLNLERNAEGVGNWEDLTGGPDAGEVSPSAGGEPPTDTEGPGTAVAAFTINGVALQDAKLRWVDRTTGAQITVKDLNLETGAVAPGEPITVTGGFVVSSETPKAEGRFDISGRVVADPDARRARFEGGALSLEASGPDLPVGELTAELKLDLDADLAKQVFKSDVVLLTVAGVDPNGQWTGTAELTGALNANVGDQQYSFNSARIGFKMDGEALPGGTTEGQATFDVDADLAAQTAALSNLALRAADLALSGNVSGENILDALAYKGEITVEPFNPRELMEKLGLEAPATQDLGVLTQLAMSTGLRGNANALSMEPMNLKLDDTSFEGSFSVRDFNDPGYQFDYRIDTIDLDRYLPPPADEAAAAPAAPVAGEASESSAARAQTGGAELPLDVLRALKLDGRATLGSVKVQNLRMNDVIVQIKAQDGLIQLDPMRMKLYDGSGSVKAVVDARTDQPKLQAQKQFQGIQAESLVKDVSGKDLLSGTGNVSANVNAVGADVGSIVRTLNGNFSLTFEDGAIKGVNVAQIIRDAKARLQGQPASATGPQQTDFAELSGSGVIKNGVVSNNDLSLKSPLLRVNGEGTVNLPAESIDYLVKTVIVGSLEGQGGKGLAELKGIPIPVRVTGTFSDPKYAPDLQAALAEGAKQKAKEEIQKKVEEEIGKKLEGGLKEQVGEQVQDKLKGLFQ